MILHVVHLYMCTYTFTCTCNVHVHVMYMYMYVHYFLLVGVVLGRGKELVV